MTTKVPPRRHAWTGVALTLPLAACGGVLDPQGPVGEANRTVLLNSLTIMLCIVVPTIVLTLLFAWWFRASNTRATYLPDWAYSGRVELVVWSIPALVVLFLAGIAWIGSHDLDPKRALAGDAIEVQVVSLDWKWLFIYPQHDLAAVNELVVPAGVPIRFRLTSATVMNAFFVPQLGSMIYTMNGMETTLHLQANPGRFEGLSSHFSGDGFPGMRFQVRALPRPEFEAWAGQAKGDALDTPAYAKLAEESSNVKPTLYRGIQHGLFDAIVARTAPEAPGPSPSPSPGNEVHPNAKAGG